MRRPSTRLAPWLLTALCGCTLSTEGTAVQAVDDGSVDGLADGPLQDSSLPVDAGSDAPTPDAAMPGCPLSGKHALQIKADVSWDAKVVAGIINIIEAGSDQLTMTVLADLDRQGNLLDGKIRVCDAQVPTFQSTLVGESYGVVFDHATWEAPGMPVFPVSIQLQCPEIGCAADIPEVTVLLGVQMADPTAAWPDDRTLLTYPDQDQDTYGGITLKALGQDAGANYRYPPTSYDVFGARADRLMLGIRVKAVLQGMLESCDTMTGTTTSLSIDTHAATCSIASTGATCNADQAAFVDGNLPQWRVNSASFSSVLLGDTADCAAARAAF